MSKKKIIIVSHVLYPAQYPRAYRTTELAKELARQGHEVVVYAALGNYDYKEFETEFNLTVKDFGRLNFEKLTSDGSRKRNFFDKILKRLFGNIALFPEIELMWKIPLALREEKMYDLIISVAVPYSIHFGCARAIEKNPDLTKKWIADCGDPFMGNKFRKRPSYFLFLEKWFIRKVDWITVPIKDAIIAYPHEFKYKIKLFHRGLILKKSNFVRIVRKIQYPFLHTPVFFMRKNVIPHYFLNI